MIVVAVVRCRIAMGWLVLMVVVVALVVVVLTTSIMIMIIGRMIMTMVMIIITVILVGGYIPESAGRRMMMLEDRTGRRLAALAPEGSGAQARRPAVRWESGGHDERRGGGRGRRLWEVDASSGGGPM